MRVTTKTVMFAAALLAMTAAAAADAKKPIKCPTMDDIGSNAKRIGRVSDNVDQFKKWLVDTYGTPAVESKMSDGALSLTWNGEKTNGGKRIDQKLIMDISKNTNGGLHIRKRCNE